MRYYYKDKNSDFYNPKFIDNPVVWIFASLMISIVSYIAIIKGYRNDLIIEISLVSTVAFIAVTGYQIYQVKRYLKTFRNFLSYLANYNLVQALNTSILNSKSSASMTNKSYRVLPKIWLWYHSSTPEYIIKIEKLAGSYDTDLDHLAQLVSSTLGDRYKITSKSISQDENWFEFVLSPVQQNLRFVPKSINDLVQKPYVVRLMNNLTINFARLPHLAIFGRTSSGKSTVLWSIILQTIGNSQLYFIDFKNEFSVLSSFYLSSHFATDTDQIIQMLQKLVSIMTERKKFVQREAKKRGVIGLTGYDLHLTPIFLVVDEFASVLSAFDNTTEGRKQKKLCESLMLQILMQSRAYSIYVLYSSQSPSTEVLSQQMRSQFGTYILLGSANGDTQRMAFGQTVTTGNVDQFSGYYLESTAKMTTPEIFEVPDIFKNKLNTVNVFRELYNRKEKKNV